MREIPDKETLTVEFKSDQKRLPDSELIEAIVGMANTDGGDLYLGVEDDGTITGVHKYHADEIGVTALIANKTVPSLSTRAEILSDKGHDVLAISIPMSRTIIATSEGKILRRRLKLNGTPENVPMFPFEINSRLSELSLLDYSERVVEGASIADLNPAERDRLRNIVRLRNGDKALLDLSDDELDKALRLAKEEQGNLHPTVTGMLLIGKEESIERFLPTARATVQVIEGTNVKVNEQYCKPLLALFEIFENYFKAWNPEREMEYGLIRIPVPEFSEAAFREGLVNAFCHRDYSILQMVRMVIEDDGMSITSPGGFVDGITINNLLSAEPHGRNQVLADALKRIGLAERTGRGIDRIYEGSIVFGRPLPDYSESTERSVRLFIQRARPDLAFAQMITKEVAKQGRMLPINSLMILSTLQTQRRATIKQLAEAVHISEPRVRANVETLLEKGLVEARGNGRGRTYILSAKVYREQDNTIGYVRQSEIDKIRHDELVLKLAKQQGSVTRADVSLMLNLSSSQSYRLLKRLADGGKLILVGEGRSSKYMLP